MLLAGVITGCGGPKALPPESVAAPVEPAPSGNTDQARLKDALTGREMPAGEVADLSDRLLADNNALNDQETMARLELLILKTLKSQDKTGRSTLWRNLGIIHYRQKKFKQARQELQAANELNPKNARTHFFLACLFAQQGKIYEKQGKKRIARQQFKRAAIEMEQARKLEPHNGLYKQDPKEIVQQENGK
jgi:Flp pilus assembly protein TadD/predicted small lipoprotein YifL